LLKVFPSVVELRKKIVGDDTEVPK